MLDVLRGGERVAIRHGLWPGRVIPGTTARIVVVGIEQLATDLERHRGNLRLLPGIPHSPNPGLIVPQGPIGIRLIAEGRARVNMVCFYAPTLRPSRLLTDAVHMRQ